MRFRNIIFLTPALLCLCAWGHWGPRVKVGLSLDRSQGRETLLHQFREEMDENKADLVLKDANGDAARQDSQVQEMIKEGVQALVVLPCDPHKAKSLVLSAHQAGIKVVSLESLIPDCDLDYFVGFDPVKAGELQAQAMLHRVPNGRFLLLAEASPNPFSKGLREGQLGVLQPLIDKGDIKIITSKEALKADAVLASDNEAVGSLSRKGLPDKVPTAGQGDDQVSCGRILTGTQTLTIYHPPKKLAEEAVYLAAKLARKAHEFDCQFVEMENGKAKTQAVLLTPLVVDAKNLEATILHDKGWKKEDLLKK